MKGCIVCNGEIRDYERAKALITECELVIAADGGIRHLGVMGVVPNWPLILPLNEVVVLSLFLALPVGDWITRWAISVSL